MSARIVGGETGMAQAIERLLDGQLVAFPTETVYGLGADARNPAAVARVFAAKGRPASNPLIVHVADAAAARALAAGWPAAAQALAEAYWPGPLTLVVGKTSEISAMATAGGDTVGLRVPGHPVALELLRRSRLALAAPSANRSEEISPTTAEHVAESLGAFVDDLLILDGGPSVVGIESTVIDVTTGAPRILRPGSIDPREVERLLGTVERAAEQAEKIARSPGQMARHYAPRTPTVLASLPEREGIVTERDGVLDWRGCPEPAARPAARISLPADPAGYAAGLYAALRDLDSRGLARIVIVLPPQDPAWDGINDRLRRAAAGKTVSVGFS